MRMIVATHNRKKLAELERILAPLGVEPVTGEDIGILLDEVEETGTTLRRTPSSRRTPPAARRACPP